MTALATNFVWKIVNWPGFWPLLTVVASLLAAWIGGRIAGKYALKAQRQAALDQRERDRETEREALCGTLRAIQAELKSLKSDNLEPFKKRLTARPLGAFGTKTAHENYFSVFESNAALLGKIEEAELITRNVIVYGQAQGFIENIKFNSRRFEFLNKIALEEGPESQKLKYLNAELDALAKDMEQGLGILVVSVDELLGLIDGYLAKTPALHDKKPNSHRTDREA